MNGKIKERCIYCGSDVYYYGTETLIKCVRCGHTLVVAKFENELARLRRAAEEGEQAKKDLAEAEIAKKETEACLLKTISTIEGIRDGQDVLSRLMQSVIADQTSAEERLVRMQDISARILNGQGDIFEGMAILGEVKDQLGSIGQDVQTRKKFAEDFVNWFQNIHADDAARLIEIDSKASELLAEHKKINDKIEFLRATALQTQSKLDEFHDQWKQSQLTEISQLYHQAENYQHDRAYDKAFDKYEQVVIKGGGDVEVAWRMLLCHYCVSYEQDDRENLIPIILNPDLADPKEMSIRRDLMEHIEGVPKDVQDAYRSELDKIDRILQKYRHVRRESEYDVFISVKQQQDGNPTKDSFVAVTLFNTLVRKGLKVFNSRLTPPPAGQEYEPYIISALMSAKAMIVVGTCTENMQSDWVRNEWLRFQWLQKSERRLTGKTDRILLCYLAEGMMPEEIPAGLDPGVQAIKADITAERELEKALGSLIQVSDHMAKPKPEASEEKKEPSEKKDEEIKVLVFARGAKIQEALNAGADYAGGEELAEKIREGWLDFDAVVATPDRMALVGSLGYVLGHRGLMPSPKRGEVTMDVAKAVRIIKGGLKNNSVVNWKDEQLEKKMREITGITERSILYRDVKPITELDLSKSRISDISSLKYLKMLKSLNLSGNMVEDISALSDLQDLKELFLTNNKITDISALSGLTNLESLWIMSNEVEDIGSLTRLTHLKSLRLDLNRIKDISSLANLSDLRELSLFNNFIKDVSSLRGLKNLEYLSLAHNLIRDYLPVAELPGKFDFEDELSQFKYHVELTSAGANKAQLIPVVRKVLDTSLTAANNIVESTPVILKEWVSRSEALRIRTLLAETGAEVMLHLAREKDAGPAGAQEQGLLPEDFYLAGINEAKNGNQVEAARCFLKAAEMGNVLSQVMLGWYYQSGTGVPKNETQAEVWYKKAVEQGNADAKMALERLSGARHH